MQRLQAGSKFSTKKKMNDKFKFDRSANQSHDSDHLQTQLILTLVINFDPRNQFRPSQSISTLAINFDPHNQFRPSQSILTLVINFDLYFDYEFFFETFRL